MNNAKFNFDSELTRILLISLDLKLDGFKHEKNLGFDKPKISLGLQGLGF